MENVIPFPVIIKGPWIQEKPQSLTLIVKFPDPKPITIPIRT